MWYLLSRTWNMTHTSKLVTNPWSWVCPNPILTELPVWRKHLELRIEKTKQNSTLTIGHLINSILTHFYSFQCQVLRAFVMQSSLAFPRHSLPLMVVQWPSACTPWICQFDFQVVRTNLLASSKTVPLFLICNQETFQVEKKIVQKSHLKCFHVGKYSIYLTPK